MRWTARPFGEWRRAFCFLPRKVGGQWVWLETIEQRFMGDCFEVRIVTDQPK